ncbi:MAG: phenylalanine--tRNA ligase beta subunit-related protein [Thermoanaerobaculales bacterium]|nr:phenylalanine--tRNA ligase beta subunit-related protein [Thermoanaerobaculales bacterium]
MRDLPFEVRIELGGWELFWAYLTVGEDQSGLADLRARAASGVRERFSEASDIAAHAPVAAMRKLFRAAGCDPTRYRPASEALLRRLVKGAELPAIHPLVDVNNCLSAELAAPCCVMKEGSLGTSLVFRPGAAGESYESLRGPFNAEAKPLLVDEIGPIDTPITGSERVKVQPDTQRAWLVAYLPKDVVPVDDAWSALEAIAGEGGTKVERFSSAV